MNTCFENNSRFNSNNRIYEGYFTEFQKPAGRVRRALDFFLYIIAAALTALTSARALCIYRTVGVAGSLVGLAGIIGAMECGTLSLGAGLLIGAALVGIEYLCLRPRKNEKAK